jgi:disulfide bond formation protein DsbB
MSEINRVIALNASTLNGLFLLIMLFALAIVLTIAMVLQYGFGEIPCPLCLLQRFAIFGCSFGLIKQLHSDSEGGTGISLIFSILLLVISARQTLLGIVPRPGHEFVGSAIFGIHMPVWSTFIALALLIGLAARLMLFGGLRSAPAVESQLIRRSAQGLAVYVVFTCAVNFLSVIVQCGMDQCHTSEYRLFH